MCICVMVQLPVGRFYPRCACAMTDRWAATLAAQAAGGLTARRLRHFCRPAVAGSSNVVDRWRQFGCSLLEREDHKREVIIQEARSGVSPDGLVEPLRFRCAWYRGG